MASILGVVRDLDRLRQIYVVLVRHGFGEVAQRLGFGGKRSTPALPEKGTSDAPDIEVAEAEVKRGEDERSTISLPERLRMVLMDLGPSFVKLGQIASTRPDVIPAEWIKSLKKLQDKVNPLPFADIKAAVETSLGRRIEDVFDRFDEEPLAAASIGQVHRARLLTDEGPREVVVKVQRPGVRTTVASDLELLHALAGFIERAIPESKLYSPAGLVDQFDRAITSELDFLLEAEHAERFLKNFQGSSVARFPRPFRAASSRQVLTLEFLPGKKVYDAIRDDGHSGPAIAKASVGLIIKMIFEDGFFHADPHPGNILISGTPEAPVIGLVDLGMVGRLSPELRDRTVDLMIAAVREDTTGIADALYQIGTPTKKVDMRAYRAEVSVLAEKYVGKPLKEIDLAAMLADLVRGANKYGIEIPPDFLLVGKALMTIDGVGKEIDPDLDVMGEARPFFIDLLKRRYSPERITTELFRGVERLSVAAYDLPQQTREILEDLRLGRLTINTADREAARAIERAGLAVYGGLVIAALLFGGAVMLASGRRDEVGYVMLALAVIGFVITALRGTLRRLQRR